MQYFYRVFDHFMLIRRYGVYENYAGMSDIIQIHKKAWKGK